MTSKRHKLNHIDFIYAAGLLDARPIKHGLNNHSYHVTTKQGDYFVRLNAVIAGVDRHREAHILEQIAPLNISPKVLLNDLHNQVLITEWCGGQLWQKQDFTQARLIRALAKQLHCFHQIDCSREPIVKDSRLDKRLLSYAHNQSARIQDHIQGHIEKLDTLGFWQANQYLCHFDLNPRNIIGRQPPTLLDWEFAGLGHPLIDWLIMEYECGHSLEDHYRKHDDNGWLSPLRALIQIMMQIWAK